mmetsp:Transcript_3995/g.10389  ORF Transcript_3995/g.10389 Transcript_3995/m.10389 type:complete len:283 (-) Transcript_3995:699-1547(-)
MRVGEAASPCAVGDNAIGEIPSAAEATLDGGVRGNAPVTARVAPPPASEAALPSAASRAPNASWGLHMAAGKANGAAVSFSRISPRICGDTICDGCTMGDMLCRGGAVGGEVLGGAVEGAEGCLPEDWLPLAVGLGTSIGTDVGEAIGTSIGTAMGTAMGTAIGTAIGMGGAAGGGGGARALSVAVTLLLGEAAVVGEGTPRPRKGWEKKSSKLSRCMGSRCSRPSRRLRQALVTWVGHLGSRVSMFFNSCTWLAPLYGGLPVMSSYMIVPTDQRSAFASYF